MSRPVSPSNQIGGVIKLLKLFKSGKPEEVMPLWVTMQYGYCGARGVMSPARLDNRSLSKHPVDGSQWGDPQGIR